MEAENSCKHEYRIRVGFNTGMSIHCKRCDTRFVPKWWLNLLVVTLPLVLVCVYAVLTIRKTGTPLIGWLGFPLVIGGVVWEMLQILLSILCAFARRAGVLERLVEAKY